MPFDIFRRHQRNMLAVFAILAMIGFILSDSLGRNAGRAMSRDQNQVIADLYDKPVRSADLARINTQRQRANRFLMLANPGVGTSAFGGSSTRELVDALILEHEADRLGIPNDARFANEWLNKVTNGAMNANSFEFVLSKFNNEVGGEELLGDLASQIRIQQVQQTIASALVTPLDVFRTYRDQSERTSFKVVPVEVASFLGQVKEPSDAEVQALYDQGKDRLPDPDKAEPGFKEPRRVKVEVLSIDAKALAKTIQAGLSEADLKAYYETRKTDFPLDGELPVDLFQGAPELTPVRYVPFASVRDTLAATRARELADDQITEKFNKIKEDVIDDYSDKYHNIADDIAERKKLGETVGDVTMPTSPDLAAVAKKEGLEYQVTPMLDHDAAEAYGALSSAQVSQTRGGDSRDFADLAFDTKLPLYDAFELVDILGRRYVLRRVADEPSHVEPLSKIRGQVVAAWKREQARPLARKAADDFAATIKKDGGTVKGLTFENRPVIDIPAITKVRPGQPMPPRFPGDFNFERMPSTPTELIQIPHAGTDLTDALFGLRPGEVAVAADEPKSAFYVMTLNQRDPVRIAGLFGPTGSLPTYYSETRNDQLSKNFSAGMTRLREEAGLKPGWAPPDETRNTEAAGG